MKLEQGQFEVEEGTPAIPDEETVHEWAGRLGLQQGDMNDLLISGGYLPELSGNMSDTLFRVMRQVIKEEQEHPMSSGDKAKIIYEVAKSLLKPNDPKK